MLTALRKSPIGVAISNLNRLRRLQSTSTWTLSSRQLDLLDEWTAAVTSSPPRILEDHISVSKVRDLYSTLPTRSVQVHQKVSVSIEHAHPPLAAPPLAHNPTPAPAAPLPPGHSLIFFHPHASEAALAPDQTSDADLGPPRATGFTRRMWASGGFSWSGALSMGREATARARVVRVERKGFEKGKPMVFVHQEIEYGHGVSGASADACSGAAVTTERRVHVYLPGAHSIVSSQRPKPKLVSSLPPNPSYSFSWTPTATTLFRFSALTFNAHLIHLDKEYSQDVEGRPERLVHGPLTALMLLEAFQHMTACDGRIASFEYQAQNPMIVGREQQILGDFDQTRESFKLWAQDPDGVVGMTGTIALQPPLQKP